MAQFFVGLHHCDRSQTTCWLEHGPGRLRSGRGPEEVHLREGEHQLSVLQRSKLPKAAAVEVAELVERPC